MKLILGAAMFLAAGASWGQSGSTYDWRTNSNYNYYTNPNGATQVYGNNYNTGSQWQTTIQPNGDQRGRDAQGNMWQYNQQSGTYMNYGTGKICTGKGYARVCN